MSLGAGKDLITYLNHSYLSESNSSSASWIARPLYTQKKSDPFYVTLLALVLPHRSSHFIWRFYKCRSTTILQILFLYCLWIMPCFAGRLVFAPVSSRAIDWAIANHFAAGTCLQQCASLSRSDDLHIKPKICDKLTWPLETSARRTWAERNRQQRRWGVASFLRRDLGYINDMRLIHRLNACSGCIRENTMQQGFFDVPQGPNLETVYNCWSVFKPVETT